MSDLQRSQVLEEDGSNRSGAVGTGGSGMCLGSHIFPATALGVQGAGLAAGEGSLPTSGGTGSDSAPPSQSPVFSEGGGEEHAVQELEYTEAGEEGLRKKRGKRKLPLPDLDAIKDADERRRQRRLIKNRNTAAASRVRKQRELEELSQRMRNLEQDNASLRSHVDCRDTEIARLRAVVDGLHSGHGQSPLALPPLDSLPPLGPGPPAQNLERGQQQEPTGEASHMPPVQQHTLHANRHVHSLDQSRSATYRLDSPAGVRGDPHGMSGQAFSQQQHGSHQPIHLEPALPAEQFAKAFGETRRPDLAAPAGQGRAAPAANSATSSLSTAEQAALKSGRDWRQPAPSVGPPRMAPHRRGGSTGDTEPQVLPMNPGVPGSDSHADFLAFPWPEVMDMVGQQDQQPPDTAGDWQG